VDAAAVRQGAVLALLPAEAAVPPHAVAVGAELMRRAEAVVELPLHAGAAGMELPLHAEACGGGGG
jgi:hypothetical protein